MWPFLATPAPPPERPEPRAVLVVRRRDKSGKMRNERFVCDYHEVKSGALQIYRHNYTTWSSYCGWISRASLLKAYAPGEWVEVVAENK